jgi:hypothetical protein
LVRPFRWALDAASDYLFSFFPFFLFLSPRACYFVTVAWLIRVALEVRDRSVGRPAR